ncbi:MAG: four helix bundle protein [Candidatus Omnitrophica bacterium]|nr:four helix bundle protein [Candidatus Omnitrophota bacterium]MDD5437218.1 four helix bundle protein [Candidatus Omnitrophota bacterium]
MVEDTKSLNTKFEYRNSKQISMSNIKNPKRYDLEERTLRFTKQVMHYVNRLPMTITNKEIGKQLIRSAGSVGANYIEANEALGKRDFAMRIKISKKESKEARYWLRISEDSGQKEMQDLLIKESTELMSIFGAILKKLEIKI